MTFTYCEKFGFDARHRAQRLGLLALGEADLRLARLLHDKAIAPHVDEIVDYFYAFLLQDRSAQAVMARGFLVRDLKRTLRTYLLDLGLDFTTPEYFEKRLRVGVVHVWAGVDLSLHLCSYRLLQQLLIDHIPTASSRYNALMAFVLKITALDMSLAVDAYHNAQLHGLEQSLEALRGRQQDLTRRLETDGLTGVLTRDHGLLVLDELIEEARDNNRPLCVIMADLDHFKQVNDTYGHLVGDDVLRDVAARMQRALRGGDAVSRYGGEEFMILLRGVALERAAEVAERVRQRVAATPVEARDAEVPMTISQGLVQWLPGEDAEALLARADQVLYEAKRLGRNRVEVDRVAGS